MSNNKAKKQSNQAALSSLKEQMASGDRGPPNGSSDAVRCCGQGGSQAIDANVHSRDSRDHSACGQSSNLASQQELGLLPVGGVGVIILIILIALFAGHWRMHVVGLFFC